MRGQKFLFAACIAISGCANFGPNGPRVSQAELEKVLGSWLGSDESKLLNSFGPPTSVFTMPDGQTMYTYTVDSSFSAPTYIAPTRISPSTTVINTYGNTSYATTTPGRVSGGQVYGGHTVARSCTVTWTVSKDTRRVMNYRYEGNVCLESVMR